MRVEKTDFRDLLVLRPDVYPDDRGYFLETFNAETFRSATGLELDFVQDNESGSAKNVIRGMHFQVPPCGQSKLVRVSNGRVLDVVIDLRTNEPTFGQHFKIELDARLKDMLFIPEGFAHGFAALEDNTVFNYKCTNFFSKTHERALRFDDPAFEIDWGITHPVVSDKDQNAQLFAEFNSPF
ncbi:MAG: dTDP-4-dehydrorhamnose 3,5-epimerase [Flavobacteriales bacterium]|nr:dTDP-4-dehydrorhamnose 3,5-epimerase [Flavobacteriales bacterium]